MTEVHRVIIQIRRPSGDDPGQVSEGFYIVKDGVLIMTHGDGRPINDEFRHVLKPVDDPAAIAGMLTRRVRRFMLGISEAEEAFNRPISYGNFGTA